MSQKSKVTQVAGKFLETENVGENTVTVITGGNQSLSSDLSNSTIVLKLNNSSSLTLPVPQQGLKFNLVQGIASRYIGILSNTTGNVFHGNTITSATAGASAITDGTAASDVDFNNTSVIGDSLSLVSDGTFYYFNGECSAFNGLLVNDW